MGPDDFIDRIRDHYVDQFRAFVADQKRRCTTGNAEVKLQFSEDSGTFARMYCADFIANDEGPVIVELQPENILSFEPIFGSFGEASLLIEGLAWDDAVITHDARHQPDLSAWFERWFDPEEKRLDLSSEFSETIHSASMDADAISVDFGTSGPDAFWDLLRALEDAGATRIKVNSSRA